MLSQKLLLSAAGNAAAARIYVDDIFGIQLRTGSGTSASSTAAVVNGIDLSGEGGIVWVKERNANNSHTLFSTDIAEVSGKRPYMTTDGSGGAQTKSNIDINFNSNGYTIEGHDGQINQNQGNTYVDWTFRKCPGFFDVVTYTGNGSNRTISHNLGSQPGMIVVKKTSNPQDWAAYHRGKGATHYGRLSGNAAFADNNTFWNDTEPTSSVFSVGTSDWVNTNNETYIAYIFAHQPNTSFVEEVYVQDYYANGSNITGPNGSGEYRFFYNSSLGNSYATVGPNSYQVSGQNKWDELSDIIFAALGQRYRVGNLQQGGNPAFYSMEYFTGYTGSTYDDEEVYSVCGSYRGNATSSNEIVLGFEPQWVLIKQSSGTKDWMMFDNMRGIVNGENDSLLEANNSNTEFATKSLMALTPTGFKLTSSDGDVNGSDDSYIYVAIRRPNKPPSAGTDVFAVDSRGSTGDGNEPTYRSGFPVDMQFNRNVTYAGGDMSISARLTQGKQMHTNLTGSESTNSTMMFDYMNGVQTDTGTGSNQYAWMFKRAPGFFDVVGYTGDGQSSRQISHNLGAVPQLILVKQRDATRSWAVYSAGTGTGKFLKLDGNDAAITQSGVFDTAPTSSIFTVETNTYVNVSGGDYIAYLFGNVDGISKVGSYTGTGSARNLDFGFTAGARFFLFKRTDNSQNWGLFDTVRGITAGNDYYITLNESDAQQTGDYVDPYSAGISLTGSVANNSGATFIYLAIA